MSSAHPNQLCSSHGPRRFVQHALGSGLSLILAIGLTGCGALGGEDSEENQECTNPDFGSFVTSMSSTNSDGATVTISNVGGTYESVDSLDFDWDSGHSGPQLVGVPHGVYTVTISDDSGCSVTEEYDLSLGDDEDDGYRVGDTGPAGGIIFYVGDDGETMETAPLSTVWSSQVWGCSGTSVDTERGRGTGADNTQAIVSTCSERDIAASLCDELVVDGIDDWYLPSLQELEYLSNTIYNYDIEGFSSGNYWSSLEMIDIWAYAVRLPDGGMREMDKTTSAYVLAVRTFYQD